MTKLSSLAAALLLASGCATLPPGMAGPSGSVSPAAAQGWPVEGAVTPVAEVIEITPGYENEVIPVLNVVFRNLGRTDSIFALAKLTLTRNHEVVGNAQAVLYGPLQPGNTIRRQTRIHELPSSPMLTDHEAYDCIEVQVSAGRTANEMEAGPVAEVCKPGVRRDTTIATTGTDAGSQLDLPGWPVRGAVTPIVEVIELAPGYTITNEHAPVLNVRFRNIAHTDSVFAIAKLTLTRNHEVVGNAQATLYGPLQPGNTMRTQAPLSALPSSPYLTDHESYDCVEVQVSARQAEGKMQTGPVVEVCKPGVQQESTRDK